MEPYAQIGDAGPFAASADLFTILVEELQSAEAAGLTACELEDLLAERGREVQRQLLQDHLDLRAAREEQAARQHRRSATGMDGVTRNRVEAGHGRLLATLFGTVQVTRCAWRRPGAPNLCPADAALSLPAPRCSHALARLAAAEAARGSFEAAHAAITRRCGPVIGKRQVEQAVVSAATDIAAFYAARVPVPCTASTLLVISADAKGIVMRPAALRPATAKAAARQGRMRTRLAAGEKPNRKRMATLTCVCDAEPSPRRPHDIIAPPGGRRGHRTLRPRPKAKAKWLAGSVRHDPAEVIAAAFSQAEARDPQHKRTWVVLVDGAEHQLDLIRAEAARRGVTIHTVIGIIHVLEYIWKAAWSLHPAGDPAAEDWVAVKALAVLAGHSARAAAEITAEAGAAGLTAAQRTGAGACVRYLTGKDECLRYDRALAAGWPIATGAIEGACRHLIGDRLDTTGARWGLDGAEAVLTMRAVISNGDFGEYRFHLAREHQRLCPAPRKASTRPGPDPPHPDEPAPSGIPGNCRSRTTREHAASTATASAAPPPADSAPSPGGRVHTGQVPRPALLLDVDGVLNPYGTATCPEGFTEYDLFPGEEPVRLCPAHGEWISELRHVFDIAWATAWNDDANRLLAPLLGIAALPVVTMPPPPFQPRDKVPPIARFAGQRPAVWIDDLHPEQAWTWCTSRREPTLLIPVEPAVGLTRQAVDQALTWARQT